MDPHRIGQLRSLALHQEVVKRIRIDRQLLARARAVFERWSQAGALAQDDVRAWQRLFAGDENQLLETLVDEAATDLRASSPFSVLLPPKDRWHLWKQFT